MSDPFSLKERRFLSWDQCLKFEQALESGSLVNRDSLTVDEVSARIIELESYERRFGYVYYGEKKWLLFAVLSTETYHDWIKRQLGFDDNRVFRAKDEFEDGEQAYWLGGTDWPFLLEFPELQHRQYGFADMFVYVPGVESGPSHSHLELAFRCLFNCSYYLDAVASHYTRNYFAEYEMIFHNLLGSWQLDMGNDGGVTASIDFNRHVPIECF